MRRALTETKPSDDSAPAWVGAPELRRALPVAAAADALEEALRLDSLPAAPQRLAIDAQGGQLLAMPAAGATCAGVKLVTVQPDNPGRGLPTVQAIYVLFADATLAPIALVDGAELTALRTSAVSAVATRHLALPDAARLVVFGAGVQARAHVRAMLAVRPVTEVTIVGTASGSAAALVADLEPEGIEARVGEPSAVGKADIVCTCTTSGDPLFDGDLLPPGCHINAIGSYQPHTREVDSRTVSRSAVVVEDRDAVLAEAGDLRLPIEEGAFEASDIAGDLSDAVQGRCSREDESSITLFKSVGVAWQDLIVVQAAAWELGIG